MSFLEYTFFFGGANRCELSESVIPSIVLVCARTVVVGKMKQRMEEKTSHFFIISSIAKGCPISVSGCLAAVKDKGKYNSGEPKLSENFDDDVLNFLRL